MKVTHAQKLELYKKGYVQIPGVVPGVMVDDAVKAINHSFGNGIDPAKMITFQSRSFCPELREAPEIIDLYNRTPVKELAESLIGTGKLNPVTAGQIAVRFPLLDDPPPALRPHLDGRYSPHTAAPNVSPHPRYAIYFRLRHVDHQDQRLETLTDIWREWDGMREIVARHREPVSAV